jgi:transcriptional regulator with XRE-family HTH domain
VFPAQQGNSAGGGPVALRIQLGSELRRLRKKRGLTRESAGWEIRASESKISRIELGRNAVREVDIADLLKLYGITDRAEREQILTLAARANQPGWWHNYQDVLPSWFQAYVGLEEAAESIRSYDIQFVPGLLQTEAYANCVLALGEFSPEETERLVFLRKERQKRFASGSLRLTAIIDEMALRRTVGDTGVMRGQLGHLLTLVDRPGFNLQVAPFPLGANVAPASFSILRFATDDLPDVVYVEQLTSALYLDKAPEVARYAAAMDRLSQLSATPNESARIIQSMLDNLEGSP